jgi:hypothetical protein
MPSAVAFLAVMVWLKPVHKIRGRMSRDWRRMTTSDQSPRRNVNGRMPIASLRRCHILFILSGISLRLAGTRYMALQPVKSRTAVYVVGSFFRHGTTLDGKPPKMGVDEPRHHGMDVHLGSTNTSLMRPSSCSNRCKIAAAPSRWPARPRVPNLSASSEAAVRPKRPRVSVRL